jgi:hypothetical protein
MADDKKPEWKQIMDQQRNKLDDRTEKLKAARLAHQATLPPEPPKKVRAKKVKAAAS